MRDRIVRVVVFSSTPWVLIVASNSTLGYIKSSNWISTKREGTKFWMNCYVWSYLIFIFYNSYDKITKFYWYYAGVMHDFEWFVRIDMQDVELQMTFFLNSIEWKLEN